MCIWQAPQIKNFLGFLLLTPCALIRFLKCPKRCVSPSPPVSWVVTHVTTCLAINTGLDFQITWKRVVRSWNTEIHPHSMSVKSSVEKNILLENCLKDVQSTWSSRRWTLYNQLLYHLNPSEEQLPGLDQEKLLLSNCTLTLSHLPLLGEHIL